METKEKEEKENPRLKIIKLLKYSSAAYVDTYESTGGDEAEAAKTSRIFLKGMQRVYNKNKEEIQKTSGIDKTKIRQHSIPKFTVDDIKGLEVKKGNYPTAQDIKDLFSSKTSTSDEIQSSQPEEIDFTKDFAEAFETSRRSLSVSQSSQENLTPNKKAKLSHSVQQPMDVEPVAEDTFMDFEPIASTQHDIFNTQAALGNINNFFSNNPLQKTEDDEKKKTAKEKLSEKFSRAWSRPVKESPKPNIAKLKPAETKMTNPWAKSTNESNVAEKKLSNPWATTKAAETKKPETKLSNPWANKTGENKKPEAKLSNPWATKTADTKKTETKLSNPWAKSTNETKKADTKLTNPWSKSTDDTKGHVNKIELNKDGAVKSMAWGSKPVASDTKNHFKSRRDPNPVPLPDPQAPLDENSIKNLFNASIRRKPDPPQPQVQVPPPVPEPQEERTPFSSFKTGRQLLSLQEANKNVRPQGLSKKHCPSQLQLRGRGDDSNPLRKKFQIPFKSDDTSTNNNANFQGDNGDDEYDHPLLKGFEKSLLDKIKRDIVVEKSSDPVTWDSIAGLESVKDNIFHSIVIPIRNPEIFGGLRQPPRAFLLFGPPGTGKTLIGKCVANQVDATFMSISASALTSNSHSETLVRAMFAFARVLQPCVIFFDEVDSLLGKRDGESGSGGESLNRLKTEFLVQLDGANSLKETDRVILIGATNRPHVIDEAMIRRFTKRILIPLPNIRARIQLIWNLLEKSGENHSLTDEDLQMLGEKTEGYSGADLKNLAVEASHIPFRKAVKAHGELVKKKDIFATSLADFLIALKIVRPSVKQDCIDMFMQWNNELGTAEYRDDDD